jgi:ABC-type antimicrobial peptide transport system permease subunit
MTTKVAICKVSKERIWSLAIVGLLTVGLTTWMVVPSMSESLQRGLSSYGNNVATYMFVYNTGLDNYNSRIPANVTHEIAAIKGVQKVYPIVTNLTHFFDIERIWTLANGTQLNMTGAIEGRQSAVIGGQGGFPQSLIGLSSGRMPENMEASFVINGIAAWEITLNQTYAVGFQETLRNGDLEANQYLNLATGQKYLRFNATAVGQMPYNPMLQQVDVLWNPTFLQQELGSQLFNQTFGGEGANYFVVKAQEVGQVKQIADKLQSIFADYPSYSVIYDQVTVEAQLSFQSGSGVLYSMIGTISLFSVISIVFLLTYMFAGRRKWEAGLLITQGWNWRRVTKLFFCYYLVLGIIAAAISTFLAIVIGSRIEYSFQVYANTLVIPILISPYLLASSLAISLLVSTVAAYFAVWRMRQMGLDNLLREY